MIRKSEEMHCPFCGEKQMFNCQLVINRARPKHDLASRTPSELPQWRCYACNVRIMVTNPSCLPLHALKHIHESVLEINQPTHET